MSTLPNLLMDFADRIARARGPKEWDRLLTEVNAAPLAGGAIETLRDMIAVRFEQELELGRELKYKAESRNRESRNGVAA